MKSPPVCIDTQICVWGIKSQAKPGQKNELQMIARAKQLFADLSKDKVSVCIPSIVLAELLVHEVGSPNAEKLRIDLSSRFNILVFNTMCAKHHAEVVSKALSDQERQKLKDMDPTLTKAKLRADIQIVSTMLGNNIKVLYTEDANLTAIAKMAGLTVVGLPGLQETIFDVAKENETENPAAPLSQPKDAVAPHGAMSSIPTGPGTTPTSDKGPKIAEESKRAVEASPAGAAPSNDQSKIAAALSAPNQQQIEIAAEPALRKIGAAAPAISTEPSAIAGVQAPAAPIAPAAPKKG